MGVQKDWARVKAVDVHDETAPRFVAEYADPEAHYLSAFRYGRKLIDDLWRETAESALAGGGEALDVGCGIGVHLGRLLDAGHRGVGIEPSTEMREQAVARLGPDAVTDGSVLDLPFDDGRFSFAYAIEVFRYLDAKDNRTGHREIARVLRPGGVYFGTYVNRWALDGFRALTGARRLANRLGGPEPKCHVEFETPNSLRQSLLDAGFSKVEVRGAMFAPLRLLYKVSPRASAQIAGRVMRHEDVLSNSNLGRPFAGHLIAIATR